MKRPLCVMLLFYVAGILFGRYLHYSIVLFFVAFIAIIIAIGCKNSWLYSYMNELWRYRYRNFIIIVMPLMSILAFCLYTVQYTGQPEVYDYITENEIEDVQIHATAYDITISKKGKQKVAAKVYKIDFGIEEKTYDSLNIYMLLPEDLTVEPGQRFIAQGEILLFDTARNPGAYNEFQHLRSNWLQFKVFPDSIEKGGIQISLNSILIKFRLHAAGIFDEILPEKEAGIMKSIILGDKSGLSEDTKELYKGAGIFHILAVSGMHVVIIAQILSVILKKLEVKSRNAGLIILSFLVIYCIFTGAGAATVRATIMSAAVIIGDMLGRDRDGATTISFAALCLLVYSPFLLFDFGFLYTFVAVYGFVFGGVVFERIILFLTMKFKSNIAQKLLKTNYVNKNIAQAIIAAAATFPLNAYFFFKLPFAGILVNIIIAPSVILIVLIGFISLILGLFSVTSAMFLSGAAYYLLNIYELLCKAALKLPLAVISIAQPPVVFIFGIYIIFVILIWYCGWDKRDKNLKAGLLKLSLAVYAIGMIIYQIIPTGLIITMLDVSQGDCTVVHKDGVTVVVDGGGSLMKEIGDNTGANIVSPYLDYLGEDTVNAAFITHSDADHAFGVIELMELKNVLKVFLPEPLRGAENDDIYEMIVQTAIEQNTEIYYIKAGDTVEFRNGIVFKCLYPYEDTSKKGNDMSIVLKMSYKETDMLLTGDIGENAEKLIVQNNAGELPSEILKVAHHGSKYSSNALFIETVSPKVALIGVSRTNSYGHPTKEVLQTLEENNVKVYTTASNGAITIKVKKGRFIVMPMIVN